MQRTTTGDTPVVGIGASGPSSVRPAQRSASRLGTALLVYMLGVTLIITLLPFQFTWPSHLRVMWTGDAMDVIANVLLFVPLGLLYRIATHLSTRHAVMRALAAGLLVSMGIEALQLFEVERYTSVLDVATNGLGAIVGAVVFDRLAQQRALDVRWIGRLFLELPLMGLIYLTIPLLWLSALVATVTPDWAWIALPLAAFGGMLLGGTLRHMNVYRGSPISAERMGVYAAAGVCVGMFPAATRAPLAIGTGAVMAFVVTRLAAAPSARRPAWNRRFEVPVLRSAAPFYAIFIGLLILLPLLNGVAPFSLGVGFTGTAGVWDKAEILRFLLRVAGMTLLGYMVAEYRGREEKQLKDALPRMLHWTLATATCIECAMGYRAGRGASIAQWSLLVLSGLYGGWLYRLQRDYVVALLEEPREQDSAPTEL
ncbi:MAG: VanZ family protein [Gemmatimonadaceae bacterium]